MSACQYEVFENPIPRARRAFPFVSVLQSDLADTGSDRIVAPLIPHARIPGAVGRLMPIVKVLGVDHVLVVPRMVPMTAADLRTAKDNLTPHRNEIIAALDLLFLGI